MEYKRNNFKLLKEIKPREKNLFQNITLLYKGKWQAHASWINNYNANKAFLHSRYE